MLTSKPCDDARTGADPVAKSINTMWNNSGKYCCTLIMSSNARTNRRLQKKKKKKISFEYVEENLAYRKSTESLGKISDSARSEVGFSPVCVKP
jgi:hypothetical protein